MQPRLFQPGSHETINRIRGPGWIRDVRRGRPHGRIEWPLAVVETGLSRPNVKERATEKYANRNAPTAQIQDETRTFITARLRFQMVDSPTIIPNV